MKYYCVTEEKPNHYGDAEFNTKEEALNHIRDTKNKIDNFDKKYNYYIIHGMLSQIF